LSGNQLDMRQRIKHSRLAIALPILSLAVLSACAAKVLDFESGSVNSADGRGDGGTPSQDAGAVQFDTGVPVPPPSDDAGNFVTQDSGTSNVSNDAGGPTCWSGDAGQCGCQQTIDSHDYSYVCGAPYQLPEFDGGFSDPWTWGTCTCTVDGQTTVTFMSTCGSNDVALQFTAPRNAAQDGCNFP
jgi:hypothetical protein